MAVIPGPQILSCWWDQIFYRTKVVCQRFSRPNGFRFSRLFSPDR